MYSSPEGLTRAALQVRTLQYSETFAKLASVVLLDDAPEVSLDFGGDGFAAAVITDSDTHGYRVLGAGQIRTVTLHF